ncbi:MAG: protein kinase, partial [Gemmatimonadota bacterium]|nr:protein kinase [Gemmatimonadota bacterium]
IELDRDQRAARLSSTAPDPEIAAEVASLLAASDRAGDFLGLLALSETVEPSYSSGDVVASRYRIEKLIGSGAMGDVYFAWDQQLERSVALKFVRASGPSREPDRAQLMAEARSAARLNHRNVATIHDIGSTGEDELFIAMAYYPGATLRDRIADAAIPEFEALSIAAQIASALAAAHAAGIVHRDVKPANVLFDQDGVIKLTDFGIAQLLTDTGESPVHSGTGAGSGAGTVAYMSPEQARAEPLDGRTDLWSLGVLLYEMLTGERPSTRALSAGPFTQLPAGDTQFSAPVRSVVASLLTVAVEKRAQSAAAVSRTLTQLATSMKPDAEPDGRTPGSARLPHPLTSFVGRAAETADARDLLQNNRLLTLTGPGGTGKTRFALHLAELMRDNFDDGVLFVPLAEISTPDLVPSVIAQSLGIRDLGGESLGDRVIASLQGRHLLLVLDNFEHVLDSGRFVARLLAAAPRLTVIATSRAPLGVQGEQELPVPPLQVPESRDSAAENSESVELFVQRARAVRPDFALSDDTREIVAEICRRLDGLPLALELAAARAKLLSPRAMLSRLEHRFELLRGDTRDRPARHVTMRDVIDWSYVLLTDAERGLFESLSVFAGGISLEAADAIAATRRVTDASASEVLDVLASLCNKSLLRHEELPDGEPRFVMLETMREFGLERLRSTGDETSARRAQRSYFLAFAERASVELRGPRQAEWFDRLEREYANCRLALDSGLNDGPAEVTDAARIAVALQRLWFTRGPLLEGVDYLRRIIAASDAAGYEDGDTAPDSALRARLLSAAAQLANTRSVFPESRDLFQRALALYQGIGDRAGVATTLNNLAWTVWIIGDLTRGETLSQSAMDMHRDSGNELGVTLSLNNLAWIAMERGDYERAEQHFEHVISSHHARGDERATAFATSWLGTLVARRGDIRRAIALQEQAIRMLEPVADSGFRMLCRVRLVDAMHAAFEPGAHAAEIENVCLPSLRSEGGRLWPIAVALTTLGTILCDDGELSRARGTLVRALEIRRQTGALHGVAEARLALGAVYHMEGNRAVAADTLAHALRDAQRFGAVPIQIECMEAIASIAAGERRAVLAAQLLSFADAARSGMGAPRSPRLQLQHDRVLERIRASADEHELDLAIRAGTNLRLSEASDLANNAIRH